MHKICVKTMTTPMPISDSVATGELLKMAGISNSLSELSNLRTPTPTQFPTVWPLTAHRSPTPTPTRSPMKSPLRHRSPTMWLLWLIITQNRKIQQNFCITGTSIKLSLFYNHEHEKINRNKHTYGTVLSFLCCYFLFWPYCQNA